MDPNARDFQFIWRHWCLNGRKKSIILRKKEDSLRRLIASGARESKLLKAADAVLREKIRVEQAKKSRVAPADTPEYRRQIASIEAKVELIRATTPEALLAEFCSKPTIRRQPKG
jgi:hypothetical protein